jgi:deferrochelatase/peroxidase EfeB
MAAPSSELDDIQGVLKTGYGNLKDARYLLLKVADAAAARTWLATEPTTMASVRAETNALQLAFTAPGLRALGVPGSVLAGFSAEFISGMDGDEGRSRRLGDVAHSAPEYWRWGSKSEVHALVALFRRDGLAAWPSGIENDAFRRGFTVVETLDTTDMDGNEPFGFADGLSQPSVDWKQEREPGTPDDLEYGNFIAAGEFLLGYQNEYGLYADRPVLDPRINGASELAAAEENPAQRDLGRNGSYLVFRELRQDVRAFWRFAKAQGGDEAKALAEAMVGRRTEGAPLIGSTHPIRGIEDKDIGKNGFTFESDRYGATCPIGAHIRRANPRTGDMPGGKQSWLSRMIRTLGFGCPDLRDDLIAASRFHRLLRRGREFGSYLEPEKAMLPEAPDPKSGLHFICLNASISRQFEFIQGAWLQSAKFGGLSDERDPVVGTRVPSAEGGATDRFGMPGNSGATRRLEGMPNFVSVVGGAYFFLPSKRALKFIAAQQG